jgi:methanogenic corrinoid protein MtbC1
MEELMASFPSSFDSDLVRRWGGESSSVTEFPKLPRRPRNADAPTEPPAENTAELAKMVESEIIPRLMLAHSAKASLPHPLPETPSLDEETTEAFTQMVISKGPESLIAYVGVLLQGGLGIENIYINLLIPAARRLGEYWEKDLASFTDVTIGLGRLQHVVRALGCKTTDLFGRQSYGDGPPERSALFAPAPGEQHTFGLFIIEDVFRRAGWRTWMEMASADEDLLDTVRCHWFDIVGLSVSANTRIEKVKAVITSLRSASRNPDVFVLVGGRLFIESPEYVGIVGADATATNGADAFQLADKAVRRVALKQ